MDLNLWRGDFPAGVGGFWRKLAIELELMLWEVAQPDGYVRPRAEWLRRRVFGPLFARVEG